MRYYLPWLWIYISGIDISTYEQSFVSHLAVRIHQPVVEMHILRCLAPTIAICRIKIVIVYKYWLSSWISLGFDICIEFCSKNKGGSNPTKKSMWSMFMYFLCLLHSTNSLIYELLTFQNIRYRQYAAQTTCFTSFHQLP